MYKRETRHCVFLRIKINISKKYSCQKVVVANKGRDVITKAPPSILSLNWTGGKIGHYFILCHAMAAAAAVQRRHCQFATDMMAILGTLIHPIFFSLQKHKCWWQMLQNVPEIKANNPENFTPPLLLFEFTIIHSGMKTFKMSHLLENN